MDSQKQLIDTFLAEHRFAIIGVSRDEKDFSRMIFREFTSRGYDVVPVNSSRERIEGVASFARIGDIHPAVQWTMILLAKSKMEAAVRECIEAGMKKLWLYGITGAKEIPVEVMELSKQHSLQLVTGYCPFMFLEKTAFFHRAHGFVWKLLGMYPKDGANVARVSA